MNYSIHGRRLGGVNLGFVDKIKAVMINSKYETVKGQSSI